MTRATDPIAAEMARQEAAEAGIDAFERNVAAHPNEWASHEDLVDLAGETKVLCAHAAKCRKLIAALMAEREARVEFDRRVGDSRDPRMGGWQALDRARKEAKAAIAEFAAPEGK